MAFLLDPVKKGTSLYDQVYRDRLLFVRQRVQGILGLSPSTHMPPTLPYTYRASRQAHPLVCEHVITSLLRLNELVQQGVKTRVLCVAALLQYDLDTVKQRINVVQTFEKRSTVPWPRDSLHTTDVTKVTRVYLEDQDTRCDIDGAAFVHKRTPLIHGLGAGFILECRPDKLPKIVSVIHVGVRVMPTLRELTASCQLKVAFNGRHTLTIASGFDKCFSNATQRQYDANAFAKALGTTPVDSIMMVGPFVPRMYENDVMTYVKEKGMHTTLDVDSRRARDKLAHMKQYREHWHHLHIAKHVDIHPGYGDASTYMLPYTSIPPIVLPFSAAQRKRVTSRQSPWMPLHTSKLNVWCVPASVIRAVRAVSMLKEPLTIVKCMFRWHHVCPPMPDMDGTRWKHDKLRLPTQTQHTRAPDVIVVESDKDLWPRGSMAHMGSTILVALPHWSSTQRVVTCVFNEGTCRVTDVKG